MKSLGAQVRISNGMAPASRIACLITTDTWSKWLKQLANSEDELTTAILGFSQSASERPSACHWALRTDQR
jgi:hypothetical protein